MVPNRDDDLMKSCYDVKRFFDVFGLVDNIATTINGLGWDLYSLDHEDGNSQFEFDFQYADGLTMADRYIFFRYLAKKLAADEGLLATFMPKPFADKTGNGAHFNMSLGEPGDRRESLQGSRGRGRSLRAGPLEARLLFRRRHPAARAGALRRLCAHSEQLQAPHPPRSDGLLLLGAGLQLLRHE